MMMTVARVFGSVRQILIEIRTDTVRREWIEIPARPDETGKVDVGFDEATGHLAVTLTVLPKDPSA